MAEPQHTRALAGVARALRRGAYPVVHPKVARVGGGAEASWIRCTRVDGDLWADGEVPLGEDIEAYRIKVIQNGITRREVTVTVPEWSYDPADLANDVGTGAFEVAIAQISARFGTGPFTTVTVGP
ncbi:MAG: hypothetical protein ACSHW1_05310 [Yoonia sp.]|uniref:hypothetical protein n=1 Tax=Yoonia sp. TaxID=2212373 RepID=UPI003EF3ABE8